MSKAMNLAKLLSSTGKVEADDLDVGTIGGRKNFIINGDMQVAQRGTSFSLSGSTAYTTDRWLWAGAGSGTATVVTNTSYPALPFEKYLSLNQTIANDAWFLQRVENMRQFSGKTVTLSYYAWADSNTGVFVGSFGKLAGSLGNHAGWSGTNKTFTTTPTRYTHTFTFADLTSSTHQDGDYFEFSFYRGSSSANTTIYITGVQLELGSVATPFEHRSYGEELALCQRYFYSTMAARGVVGSPTVDHLQIQGTRHQFADVSGYRSQLVSHPVTMRSDPTVTFYSGSSGSAGVMFLYAHNGANQDFSGFTYSKEDSVKFCGYTGVSVGSTGLSTECWVHYEMDAEL